MVSGSNSSNKTLKVEREQENIYLARKGKAMKGSSKGQGLKGGSRRTCQSSNVLVVVNLVTMSANVLIGRRTRRGIRQLLSNWRMHSHL